MTNPHFCWYECVLYFRNYESDAKYSSYDVHIVPIQHILRGGSPAIAVINRKIIPQHTPVINVRVRGKYRGLCSNYMWQHQRGYITYVKTLVKLLRSVLPIKMVSQGHIMYFHPSIHTQISDKGDVHAPFYGVSSTRVCRTPAIHASLSNGSTPARPHLLTFVFTHSDHVFLGLPCVLVPRNGTFVIKLKENVALCTSYYHLSRRSEGPTYAHFCSSEAEGWHLIKFPRNFKACFHLLSYSASETAQRLHTGMKSISTDP